MANSNQYKSVFQVTGTSLPRGHGSWAAASDVSCCDCDILDGTGVLSAPACSDGWKLLSDACA